MLKLNLNRISIDRSMLSYILALVLIGIMLVYDASLVYSEVKFASRYYFLIKQSAWMVFGILSMLIVAHLDLEYIKRYSLIIFVTAIVFLIFVLVPYEILGIKFNIFAPPIYGAKRWIFLNPDPLPTIPYVGRLSFQPSEFMKLSAIIYLAAYLSELLHKRVSGFIINRNFILLTVISCGLIILQPNLSTTVILASIFISLYFLSGAPIKYLLVEIPIVLALIFLMAINSSYRLERINTLFSPSGVDVQNAGYHIHQIMIALGSGGLIGKGLGSSVQKHAYLPEVNADSIFAILGEELGFIGASLLVTLYGFLIWRGFLIAKRVSSLYESLIVYGVMIWIAVQTLINLLAMVKLFPLTGVPLPLVSYGGSSSLFLLIALGLVLNISRRS